MPAVEPRSDAPGAPSRRAPGRSARVSAVISDLVAGVAQRSGFDLEDLSVVVAGRRKIVRVVVDSDSGVDLDDIAQLSREISTALDDSGDDLIDGAYQLEVSSPGIDRPLTEQRHWRRAAGRLVKVEVAGNPLVGRVVSADAGGVVVSVDGDSRTIDWAQLGAGHVQVEFNREGSDGRAAGQTGEAQT
jgi:ribosome maturation factor RimP